MRCSYPMWYVVIPYQKEGADSHHAVLPEHKCVPLDELLVENRIDEIQVTHASYNYLQILALCPSSDLSVQANRTYLGGCIYVCMYHSIEGETLLPTAMKSFPCKPAYLHYISSSSHFFASANKWITSLLSGSTSCNACALIMILYFYFCCIHSTPLAL